MSVLAIHVSTAECVTIKPTGSHVTVLQAGKGTDVIEVGAQSWCSINAVVRNLITSGVVDADMEQLRFNSFASYLINRAKEGDFFAVD